MSTADEAAALFLGWEDAHVLRHCLLEALTDEDVFVDAAQIARAEEVFARMCEVVEGGSVRFPDLEILGGGPPRLVDYPSVYLTVCRIAVAHGRKVIEDWEAHARVGVDVSFLNRLHAILIE